MKTLHKFYLNFAANGPDRALEWVCFLGLWPLSCLYWVIVRLRLLAYALGLNTIYRASVPVVSVGNITVGGTGKTPMTDFLAKWAKRHDLSVAIVSRGYGGDYTESVLKVCCEGDHATKPSRCGDEPFLLARKNPTASVFVARRRALGVMDAEESGAQLILLDDGFQHRAVHRDLDIVLLDGQNPYGNGHMLPAGQLREPLSSLQRSDLIVKTRSCQDDKSSAVASKPVLKSQHSVAKNVSTLSGEICELADLIGKSCVAFAGIARPCEFFNSLKKHGLTLAEEIPLVDHQVYDESLRLKLIERCKGYDALITTEKDAVKLLGMEFPVPCYQVGVDMVFEDTTILDELLNQVILKKTLDR